ncbi:MAG: hypothetical protein ACLRTG_13655 [Enterocloster aldenensis]
MLNKGKILWCIWAGILVLLFLMSSTDLIIKEKEIEVYPVSVIIDGDNDDYYVNFKKGMDQAAVEFHGDVSFITLYADHDQAQQMELVKREIRDGTRAVILAPVMAEEAVKELEGMNMGLPCPLSWQPTAERKSGGYHRCGQPGDWKDAGGGGRIPDPRGCPGLSLL